MIYAATKEVETRCRPFLRKWKLRCPTVAASLEEAGDRLFGFVAADANLLGCAD